MNNSRLRIAIDCDDAAIDLKNIIFNYLKSKGSDIVDLKLSEDKSLMYPDIGYNLALKVQNGEFDRGILLCGTGLGMSMIANKVEGVYAGVCHDVFSAERLVKSNNGQILTMGARVIGPELAKMVINAFITSEFQGNGSLAKVKRMNYLERQTFHKEV